METVQTKNCLLNQQAIQQKLKRMALEVAEQNIDEKEIILAGINGNGEVVARCLAKEMAAVHPFQIQLTTVQLNKKEPLDVSVKHTIDFHNKVIILIDDVANTGKVLLYALKAFLNAYPKKIQTLVLVERSHKLFPIQSDYTGLSLATTLQEHITVETEGDKITGAWLF